MCPLSKVMATAPWRCGVWSIIDTNSGGISQPGGWECAFEHRIVSSNLHSERIAFDIDGV